MTEILCFRFRGFSWDIVVQLRELWAVKTDPSVVEMRSCCLEADAAVFGNSPDVWRPAGTPHAAAPPCSHTASTSPLSSYAYHPHRLPRRTPHLLVVVHHAPAAHWQNTPAERRRERERGGWETREGLKQEEVLWVSSTTWSLYGGRGTRAAGLDTEVRWYMSEWANKHKGSIWQRGVYRRYDPGSSVWVIYRSFMTYHIAKHWTHVNVAKRQVNNLHKQ